MKTFTYITLGTDAYLILNYLKIIVQYCFDYKHRFSPLYDVGKINYFDNLIVFTSIIIL